MRRRLFAAIIAAFAPLAASSIAQSDRDELALYRAGRWFELRAIMTPRSPALIQGAVAVAFNDPKRAERFLRDVIRSERGSDAAEDAYALLCRTYLTNGLYARFVSTYREWGAAFPKSLKYEEQRNSLIRFGGRPDQINERTRPMRVKHEPDSFTVPVTINGRTEDFLLDTGALHSVMTDREARKLGLTVSGDVRLMTGASGDSARFRTAIAKNVMVGATSFHDVSFAVMEPVGPWRDAEVGVVGLPLFIGVGAIRWSHDGSAELGQVSRTSTPDEANLVLDRGRLLMKADVLGQGVILALDTGADATDLNENFATQFRSLVVGAKRTRQDITGVGGTRTFDALELPEVAFAIGPTRVYLRPAKITLQRVAAIGGECCVGNAGRDLLLQSSNVTIDLKLMTVRLQ
jgi:predicted aspartyl protease